MGDIKRKRRSYEKPRQLFDRVRIDEENVLVQNYGLKNKREIWKAKSVVSKFRKRAKNLIAKSAEEQQKFFEKLNNLGIPVTNTADVLALTEKDLLNRRLQTFVVKKELAQSPKQARQLIVHKHIMVDGNIVNIPSFWVTRELEQKLELRPMKVKAAPVQEEKNEDADAEATQEESDNQNEDSTEENKTSEEEKEKTE